MVSNLFSPVVSNLFSDSYPDVSSFSELLAGAMASPASQFPSVDDYSNQLTGFKQNRPGELAISQSPSGFVLPSVFTPSAFLNSPIQTPFGMSHQQPFTHVTAQPAISLSYLDQIQPAATKPSHDQLQMLNNARLGVDNSQSGSPDEPSVSQPDISEPQHKSFVNADTNDVYNWRKYGQKQLKAGERGYYKCTHVNCPAKKQVWQSRDGRITDIVYKGKHNHDPPQPSKRAREGADVSKQNNYQVGNRVAENQLLAHDRPEDEPNSKRRATEAPTLPIHAPGESTLSNKMGSEQRVIIETRSEVDLLDDGFRWRKYGQKNVNGNTNPRSYFKCTYAGCNVRKHVQRAPLDLTSVVTTYEGKHNHDIPVSRHRGSSNNGSGGGQAGKSTKPLRRKDTEIGSNSGRSDLLQMKEEVITV